MAEDLEKRKLRMRSYYAANKDRWRSDKARSVQAEYRKRSKSKILEANNSRRRSIRECISILKSKPCSDCGQSFPPYVMDFDHRVGKRSRADVSSLIDNGARLERVLEEIEKCDLVCSNCHRIRTHARRIIDG